VSRRCYPSSCRVLREVPHHIRLRVLFMFAFIYIRLVSVQEGPKDATRVLLPCYEEGYTGVLQRCHLRDDGADLSVRVTHHHSVSR
jgi:hypothetical protein